MKRLILHPQLRAQSRRSSCASTCHRKSAGARQRQGSGCLQISNDVTQLARDVPGRAILSHSRRGLAGSLGLGRKPVATSATSRPGGQYGSERRCSNIGAGLRPAAQTFRRRGLLGLEQSCGLRCTVWDAARAEGLAAPRSALETWLRVPGAELGMSMHIHSRLTICTHEEQCLAEIQMSRCALCSPWPCPWPRLQADAIQNHPGPKPHRPDAADRMLVSFLHLRQPCGQGTGLQALPMQISDAERFRFLAATVSLVHQPLHLLRRTQATA